MRRKFPLDEQALSRFASMLARRPETKRGDMTQSFGSGRSGCLKDESKPSGSSGDDGEDEGQVGT